MPPPAPKQIKRYVRTRVFLKCAWVGTYRTKGVESRHASPLCIRLSNANLCDYPVLWLEFPLLYGRQGIEIPVPSYGRTRLSCILLDTLRRLFVAPFLTKKRRVGFKNPRRRRFSIPRIRCPQHAEAPGSGE